MIDEVTRSDDDDNNLTSPGKSCEPAMSMYAERSVGAAE